MVEDQGNKLRTLSFEQLLLLWNEPKQEIVLGGRKGQISIIAEPCEGEMVKVGSIVEMRNEEFHDYD